MSIFFKAVVAVTLAGTAAIVNSAKLTRPPAQGTSLSPASAPPATVVDLIGLTKVADGPLLGDHIDPLLSPDGKLVVLTTYRGNLARNTRDYELLLFRAEPTPQQTPRVLARFSSSTTRPGISRVRWLADSDTLAFIGEQPEGLPQVYTLSIRSGELIQRTHADMPVRHFDIDARGDVLAYAIDQKPAPPTAADEKARKHGYVLPPDGYLLSLLDPRTQAFRQTTYEHDGWETLISEEPIFAPLAVWRQKAGEPDRRVTLPGIEQGYVRASAMNLRLSSNGTHVLLPCQPRTPPSAWTEYNQSVQPRANDEGSREWVAIDLGTNAYRAVIGTPITQRPDFSFSPAWVFSKDGRSVIFGTALLPLDVAKAERVKTRYIVEVNITTGALNVIAPLPALPDIPSAPRVVVDWRPGEVLSVSRGNERWLFHKTGSKWQSANPPKPDLRWTFRESLNDPVTLGALSPSGRGAPSRPALEGLFTPVFQTNPNLFTTRKFGRVTEFHWPYDNGQRSDTATLYWPPDYRPNQRYPLVIQGHGKSLTKFWPDGNTTTKHAAQPLANAGIFVVQFNEGDHSWNQTGFETYRASLFAQIEGIIDQLDRSGLIDRQRVGLSGVSTDHGAFMHFMTHSSYPIAAAALAEGVEFSYFTYLSSMGHPWESSWADLNGGLPWGEGRARWLERAPGFNLERIRAAIQFEASGDSLNVIEVWEGYQGLRALGRPVELVLQPDATHLRLKPWDRFTSQQGAVDWLRFWLQGYERSEPVAAAEETANDLREKYARWRAMRRP